MVGLLPMLGADRGAGRGSPRSAPTSPRACDWLQRRRPELVGPVLSAATASRGREQDAAVAGDPERLRRVLARMFDPAEFLSPYGIRSLSKTEQTATEDVGRPHASRSTTSPANPPPACSAATRIGVGPVWFPVNVLLADKLRTYGRHFGESFKIAIPTGSGNLCTLEEAADVIDGGLAGCSAPSTVRRARRRRRAIEGSDNPLWRAASHVLRVLRRGHRRGARRHPPDRMDGLVAHLHNPRLPMEPPDLHRRES